MLNSRIRKIVGCVALILILLWVWKNESFKQITGIKSNNPKKHVFFDIGTNNGDSIRFFLFGKKGKNDTLINGYAAHNKDIKWDIYAFEANPNFNEELDKLKEECELAGHSVFLYKQTAVWTYDGLIKFYIDTVNVARDFWGSSLLKEHPDVRRSNQTFKLVNAVDVSKIIEKYNVNDEIIVKVDIEGAEYEVLVHWFLRNVYKYIDIIAIEWHKLDDFRKKDIILEKLAENKVYIDKWF